MGGPIAGHLLAEASSDRLRPGRPLAGAGGSAGSPRRRLGARARALERLVIVVVGFDSEVEEVIFGHDGVLEGARPGLVVAPARRSRPAIRSGRRAPREKNLRSSRHPARAWRSAATAGKLLIYGRGRPRCLRALRPAFGAFASDIFHLGPAGAGQVAKMVNNLILWACIAVNDEDCGSAGRWAWTRSSSPRPCVTAARRTGP